MGCFDEVIFDCTEPECEGVLEIQSKSGECDMATFRLDAVPMAIAADIDGDVVSCDQCEASYRIASPFCPGRIAMVATRL